MTWENIGILLGYASFIWLVTAGIGRAFFTGGGGHRGKGWR